MAVQTTPMTRYLSTTRGMAVFPCKALKKGNCQFNPILWFPNNTLPLSVQGEHNNGIRKRQEGIHQDGLY